MGLFILHEKALDFAPVSYAVTDLITADISWRVTLLEPFQQDIVDFVFKTHFN